MRLRAISSKLVTNDNPCILEIDQKNTSFIQVFIIVRLIVLKKINLNKNFSQEIGFK